MGEGEGAKGGGAEERGGIGSLSIENPTPNNSKKHSHILGKDERFHQTKQDSKKPAFNGARWGEMGHVSDVIQIGAQKWRT